MKLDDSFAEDFESACKDNSGGRIELAAITRFPWDQVLVIRPYQMPAGLRYREAKALRHLGIMDSDGICALVFRSDAGAPRIVAFPRSRVDLAKVEMNSYTPTTAVFDVESQDDGRLILRTVLE